MKKVLFIISAALAFISAKATASNTQDLSTKDIIRSMELMKISKTCGEGTHGGTGRNA